MSESQLSPESRVAIDRGRIREYVRGHAGQVLTNDVLGDALGVSTDTASYWLRDRASSKRRSRDSRDAEFDRKIYRVGYGQYVYFPGPVPIDWRDRITDYQQASVGRDRRPKRKAAPTVTPDTSTMFETIRYNPDTNRVLLADDQGNVWTGTLVRVEV